MFRRNKTTVVDEDVPTRKEFDVPLEELHFLLDELQELVDHTLDDFLISLAPPPPVAKSRRAGLVDSLKKLRRNQEETSGDTLDTGNKDDLANKPESQSSSTPKKSVTRTLFGSNRKNPDAKFLPVEPDRIAHWVENLRRLAELVVTGERVAASADQQQKKVATIKDKKDAGGILTPEEEELLLEDMISTNEETDKYIAIFEVFFERNGLALITSILTGSIFDLEAHQIKRKQTTTPVNKDSLECEEVELTALDMIHHVDVNEHAYVLLPPISVATQAIQSVSILVQNVSRATSLFFILSNNHVNQLIDFPLEEYRFAERTKVSNESQTSSPRRFGSPELAELTTHFVTFLKSLAMRMNAETLQFFLAYPENVNDVEFEVVPDAPVEVDSPDDDRPLDEIVSNKSKPPPSSTSPRPITVKVIDVKFPLYERALEFCAVHQDSFVRVTAMNICLNTLRLATVQADDDEADGVDLKSGSSPDGVLHNAKPLPLRERLAIANYVCSPARVERLASPIFTKLAQLWGILEEQFREMDAPIGRAQDDMGGGRKASSSKVARAKEKARRSKTTGTFNDSAYNVQDEMLLLEDMLKIGLTSLNEQTIEMMFATFVYPLLLQPLLLYFQRSPVPDEVLFADPLNDHSAGREVPQSDLTAGEKALIAAPAKSAFFFLSAAFQFLTNPPLLRLLFTALLHPLAPESSGETMIRAKADVACKGAGDKVTIRMDPVDKNGKMKPYSDRSSYEFGTVTGRKCKSGHSDESDENTCVFVLSPALSEILEFRGDDGALVARSRHNPYRQAVFKCFTLCSQLSDLRPLSVMAVDSAVSVLDGKVVADILFGLDLRKFQDNIPKDERTSDSDLARVDDRGMGAGFQGNESRLSLGAPRGGKVGFDHMNEVISSFRNCLIRAVPGGKGTWKLEYDLVAAHALLTVVRSNRKALLLAGKGVDGRCRQAAAFLADVPNSVVKLTGPKLRTILDHLDGRDVEGAVMEIMFRGRGVFSNTALLTELVELKQFHQVAGEHNLGIQVAAVGSYQLTCSRSCQSSLLEDDQNDFAMTNGIGSALAWSRLDAFSTLLNTVYKTEAVHIQQPHVGGFFCRRDGKLVNSNDQSSVHAPLSQFFSSALLDEDKDDMYFDARPGRILSLVGHVAFPCVCEVPPSSAPLFSEAGAKVVSQGITWQSLYLVILGRNVVLAEPERRTSGEGRIVTSCKAEHLSLEKDDPDVRSDTSARRLIVSHRSPDIFPPGLFLFDKKPTEKDEGGHVRVVRWRSSLDVWFEDTKAVDHAFGKVTTVIHKSVASRGKRLKTYLAQGENSAYPMSNSLYSSSSSLAAPL